MAYTTEEKVKAMFRKLDTTGSNAAITTAKIDIFIEEADAYIDTRLFKFYTVPVTGSISLKLLSKISTLFVAEVIDQILNNYSDASKKPMYGKMAMKMLDDLIPVFNKTKCEWCDPISQLPDAVYNGPEITTGTVSIKAVSEPQFKKGVDAW